MPTLIKDGRVVSDDWVLREEIGDGASTPHSIVPASYALAHADALSGDIGIWLPGDGEPDEIAPLLAKLPLIAIRFRGDERRSRVVARRIASHSIRIHWGTSRDRRGSRGRAALHAPMRHRLVSAPGRSRSSGRVDRDEVALRFLSGVGARTAPRLQTLRARPKIESDRCGTPDLCHNRPHLCAAGYGCTPGIVESFFLIFAGAAVLAAAALYTRQPLLVAYIAVGGIARPVRPRLGERRVDGVARSPSSESSSCCFSSASTCSRRSCATWSAPPS